MPSARAEFFSVTELNNRARALLEQQLAFVKVRGEVSGHKVVAGHHYFCLKDRDGQLGAVMFRREAMAQALALENGLEVIASGRLTIYNAYGRYQLVVEQLAPFGAGELQAAFEELKARLLAEGLFARERKRPLPHFPRVVAVVTSPTGAVVRDIVDVATRRLPGAKLLIVPARVQGEGAAGQVAAALGKVSELASKMAIDVVIVARGGGSVEDLAAFNTEVVARAIAATSVPVVSAVGHETDVTIADFVADVRAPTPSAAAELIFPVRDELCAALAMLHHRSRVALFRRLGESRLRLRALRAELGDGRALLREPAERIGYACLRQQEAQKRLLLEGRLKLREAEGRLLRLHPKTRLGETRGRLVAAYRRLGLVGGQVLGARRERLKSLLGRLTALSPLGVLDRGYALALDAEGHVLRDAAAVAHGDLVNVRLARGQVRARVE